MKYMTAFLGLVMCVSQASGQSLSLGGNELVAASAASTSNERPRVLYTDDGVAHVMWVQGSGSAGQVVIAADADGTGYGDTTPLSDSPTGIQIDAAAGPSLSRRGVYLVAGWMDRQTSNRGIFTRRSTDMGGSWEPERRVDPAIESLRAYESAALYPDGRVAQVFMVYDPGYLDPGYVWTGEDLAGDFSVPIEVSASAPGEVCECCYPDHVILDDGQTVLVCFRNNHDNLREFYIARSTDGGMTFPELHHVDTTGWVIGGCPSSGAALAEDGTTVLAIWRSVGGSMSHIWLSRSDDGGASWAPMQAIDGGDGTGFHNYPDVAIRGSLAVAAWESIDESGLPVIVAVASVDGGITWGPPTEVSDGSEAAIRSQVAVDIAPDETVELVWKDDRSGGRQIYYARGTISTVSVHDVTPTRPEPPSIHPNPVRDQTTIRFRLSAPALVRLGIYSVEGRERAHLVTAELDEGVHAISWDGRGNDGAPVPPGVYFVRLVASGVERQRRVVVIPGR